MGTDVADDTLIANATVGPAPAPRKANVGRARVLAGLVSFKDTGIPNLSNTYKGRVLLEDGTVQHAIVKDLPIRELANEVLAAALGIELGLPIPRAYLASAATGVLATSAAPKQADGSSVVFASLDAQSPSISQIVAREPDRSGQFRALATLARAIASTTSPGGYYGFDAWTANVDRHVGNLLFAPGPLCWLIDHGRCFTGHDWKPADLQPDGQYRNRLHEWLTPLLTDPDKDKMVAESSTLAARLSSLDIGAIAAADDLLSLLGQKDFDAVVEFLSNRIQHARRLGALALDRIA